MKEMAVAARMALNQGDWVRASHLLSQITRQNRGIPWNECTPNQQKTFFSTAQSSGPPQVTAHKLQHDIEQIQYLIDKNHLPQDFDVIISTYQTLLKKIQKRHPDLAPYAQVELLPSEQASLSPWWGRNLYLYHPPEVPQLLNPNLDIEKIEYSYFANQPGFSFGDNFLSPKGLSVLRELCWRSTFWNDFKRGGYIGSYLNDGFSHPLILKLSAELKQTFPKILKHYPLTLAWSYKYDARFPGVGIHADSGGKINFNLWLTDDQANLSPENGGLIIYDVMAPKDWDPRIYQLKDLAPKGCKYYVLPYRSNRALFFNSGLFHASDRFEFKPGYLNRRLNITLLFGIRGVPDNEQLNYYWE